LRLSLEVNDTAEHNGFTTDFSLWVRYKIPDKFWILCELTQIQVLYPLALGTSIFSMQPSVIPFDLTPMWYFITVCILMAGMTFIHWVMKSWLSSRKEISVLAEATQQDQETDRLLEKINRTLFPRRIAGDVENSTQSMGIMNARTDTF
jgi:hypothetical protein